tara:strand:- start:1979 stop:2608 length:630 start_codon:yes stop_codon:yes gene_type:complete
MSGEEAPKQYQFKHAEYVPYLKEKEGSLEFQASQGKYDPETQEFIAWPDKTSKGIVPTVGFGTTPLSSTGFNVEIGQRVPLYVADMALDQEIEEKLKVVNKHIPVFNSLPKELRIPMLSSFYRGGLSGSPKTIKKINEGDFKGAAKEFLNNAEYRKSKEEGTGVHLRMEELANVLSEYGKEIKKDKRVPSVRRGGMVQRNPYPYNARPI